MMALLGSSHCSSRHFCSVGITVDVETGHQIEAMETSNQSMQDMMQTKYEMGDVEKGVEQSAGINNGVQV
jgi:hypothetical protein